MRWRCTVRAEAMNGPFRPLKRRVCRKPYDGAASSRRSILAPPGASRTGQPQGACPSAYHFDLTRGFNASRAPDYFAGLHSGYM